MRIFFTCILLANAIFLNAQTTPEEKEVKSNNFSNQGEWENYEIRKIFKTNYSRQTHQVFQGKIIRKGDCYLFDKDFIEAFTNDTFQVIFEKGILYPELVVRWLNPDTGSQPKREITAVKKETSRINFDSLTILNFEEIRFVDHLPTQRRFKCWIAFKFMFNAIICLVELTNDSATEKTDMQTFIKGASLTFFRQFGVVL
jgi:hypothetical protein